MTAASRIATSKGGRRYPDRPIVGVLAVVMRGDRVLVVRRANPPMPGRWGFPGGVLELGETVAQGAMRELFEETGVVAEAGGPLTGIYVDIDSGEALCASIDLDARIQQNSADRASWLE